MAKTKYTLNSYFRVLYDCTLFAVKLKKNDLLCFNSRGWRIISLQSLCSTHKGQSWYYAGCLKDISTDVLVVLVPLKKNELRNLLIIEVDTR